MRLDDDLKYFETPEFKRILETYEAAMSEGKSVYMDADELTDIAEYYSMVTHDDAGVDEAIALALQLHPDAVDPQIFQARQAMFQGDYQRSLELCNAIEDQEHREVFFLKAELMVRQGQCDQARQLLITHAEEVTEDYDYFLYDSAYIFIDYQDYQSALFFAEKLEQIAPIWFKTWELCADVHLALESFKKALTYIERMLDKDAYYVNAWNWRAEAYCGLQDLEQAFASTDFALAISPDNERAMELKAWILMRQENFEEAHQLYEQLQARVPESEIHCLYDSFCLFDLGRIDDSLRLILRAEQLAEGMSAEQPAIYEHHAHILSEQGKVEEALRYIDFAEEAQGQDAEEIAPGETWQDFDYYRARIFADNGDSQSAIRYIERIAQKGREDVISVLLQGAQILFEASDYANACELLNIVLKQETDIPEELLARAYPFMAACLHELGEHQQCLDYLRLSIEHNSPEMSEILSYIFPNGVQPTEYYDYYYFNTYGRWPE